jgi:hypothetical protein
VTALLGGSQGVTLWVCAGTDGVNGFRLFFALLPGDGFHTSFSGVEIAGVPYN